MQQSRFLSDRNGTSPKSKGRGQRICQRPQSVDNQDQSQRTIRELFGSSKHTIRSPKSPSNKRLKTSSPSHISESSQDPAKTLKSEDMYTFNSTSPRDNSVVDLTKSPDGSLQKPSFTQNRPPSFAPQAGAKKLVVKNLRKTPKASPDQYFELTWSKLNVALSSIFENQKISLEELYRGVENICRLEKAPTLYQKLCERCKDHVSTKLKARPLDINASGASEIEILRAVVEAWTTWRDQLNIIRSIFYYMDRSYLLHSLSQPSIEEMGIIQFRNSVVSDSTLKPKVLQGACDLVAHDRETHSMPIDALFKESIEMFHTLLVYTKEFEPKLLGQSQRFFTEWADKEVSSKSLAEYVSACHELIRLEMARCDLFRLPKSTKTDLTTQLERFLITDKEMDLVSIQEVSELMELTELNSLSKLFELLQRKSLGDRLRPAFERYINNKGSNIVFDEAREGEMVVRLLTFKKKLDNIWEHSFARHEGLGHSLREAFESFINKTKKSNMTWGTDNNKPGEMIAKYVDIILRGGSKAIPHGITVTIPVPGLGNENDQDDETIDEEQKINKQLDQVLDMFRFVHGKDVFEAFYKLDLARRLLMDRSASADAEKYMLNRLKSECGSGFTHNLEQMFKDMELAREENKSYRQMLDDHRKKPPVDLNVNVLSQSAWPSYPDVTVEVPLDIQKVTADYEQHYKIKHNGRKLYWKHALAHCQIKATFSNGNKELVVSSFQAIVLLYFNGRQTNETVGYTELKAATCLSNEELIRTLQSLACAKYRVLAKSTKGKEIHETDTFCVNLNFTDQKYRIKINQIQLKETKEENKETHERVVADRHYETQAAIVRILKGRKKIKHAELVAEVIKATKSRGVLDPADIKKNIEKLIEKDYMEREDGGVYSYLA